MDDILYSNATDIGRFQFVSYNCNRLHDLLVSAGHAYDGPAVAVVGPESAEIVNFVREFVFAYLPPMIL